MDQAFHALLTQRVFVFLLGGILVAAGLLAWQQLPIDAFPDVTNTQVMVLTKAEGFSALDVEQRVTFPLEQRMGGLPRVREVRSTSKAGLSQLVVVFEDGVDIYFGRQVVLERIQEAASQLPPGIEPELAPITTGLGEIFQYTLDSASASAMDLRTLQDWVVAPQLRPLAGVTEVNSFGGFLKQYHVLPDPDRLQKYGITLPEIVDALDRNNANAPGHYVTQGWEQRYIRAVGLLTSIADIENIVLRAPGGVPIRIRDVARVEIGHAPRQGAVTRDGRGEVVAGMVMMLKDENSKTVVDRVKNRLPQIRQSLPPDVHLNVFYDRTSLIQACLRTVLDALLDGGLWVVVVLFVFLAELSTSLIVVVSIPFTFLASFVIMKWWGLSSNLMSLGGLAFTVGMVSDASIVVIENARRHLRTLPPEGSRIDAVARATTEVMRPLTFSVCIIVIVLVPLLLLEGMEGKMFGPLALTMLISLLASLGVALLLVPAFGVTFLPQGEEREFRIIKWGYRLYERILGLALRAPLVTGLIALVLLGGIGSLARTIGTEFMPPLDEGAIAINVVRLPNASLEGAVKVSTIMEQALADIPEIAAVVSKTGRAEISEDPMGPEQTDLVITLKEPGTLPGARPKAEVLRLIQERLEKLPGLRFSYSQPIALRVNELISGIKSDVAVKVFGEDLDTLTRLSGEVLAALGKTRGASDVKATQLSTMSQLDVQVDRAAASRYGLNVAEINDLIGMAVGGRVATTLIEGQRRFDVLVRYPPEVRADAEAIARLKVTGPGGQLIPLGQVARIAPVEVPIEITRENGQRRVVIEANIRARDLGGFVAELQENLRPIIARLPQGYFIQIGGQFENQQRAMARLSIVVPIALLLILILLVMALGSFRNALLVLANLPFALVGGIAGLWWYDMPFTVSAAIAFIVLLGVAVQDGVLLVTFYRQLLQEGHAPAAAVRLGSVQRFRPLMMTTLTTFIGHLPMIISTGSGADIQKPLAVVVNFGLLSSTFLTLLVLPALFLMVESLFRPAADDTAETVGRLE